MLHLPNEIINLILSYRDPHPLAKCFKSIIKNYNKIYDDDDNYLSFIEYFKIAKMTMDMNYDHSYNFYINYNVKGQCKRNNELLICCRCNKDLQVNDIFMNTSKKIECYDCYYRNFIRKSS